MCRTGFILVALLNLISLASSTFLYYRTRHIYRAEYAEVHQHDQDMVRPHLNPSASARVVDRVPQPSTSSDEQEMSPLSH